MFVETVRTAGLAQLSYVVGDESAGVCAVVDPRRDVDAYLEVARDHDVRVIHALETHVHADFVSGSAELKALTGCSVGVGATGDYGWDPDLLLAHGDVVELGEVSLEALHTPGHSPEHLSFALSAGDDPPFAVLTGDTLFAGSVGRPDLAAGREPEAMARDLWRSLTGVLLPLGDELLVLPGHGAGSPCGADIGDRDVTTLGWERRHSETLSAPDADAFVEAVLADLPDVPAYYPRMKELNARGPEPVGGPVHAPALSPSAFAERVEGGALVVDAREIEAFGAAHLAGAVSVPLRTSFPVWAGRVLDPERPLLLVLPSRSGPDEALLHLHRIGLDRVEGWLAGGMRSWIEDGRDFERRRDLSVHDLRELTDGPGREDGLQVLDVREDAEWDEGHVPGARHLFAAELADEGGGVEGHGPVSPAGGPPLDPERPVAVYCGSGYRSSLAASLLERRGFADVRNVVGAWSAWTAAGYPVEGEG